VAGELNVELVAPDGRVWSGTARTVVAKTTEGEIGIMPGHEPVLGLLVTGPVTVRTTGDETVVAAVHGGFLSVANDNVTVLAEVAERAEDIDVARAQAALERAGADDENADARRRAEIRLRVAGARYSTAGGGGETMTVMETVAVIVAGLAILVALALGALFVRRAILQRQGGSDLCLGVGRAAWSDGWVFGIARYRGDVLEWFRTFSYGTRVRRVLPRRELTVVGRRTPDPEEAYDLPAGHVVLVWEVNGERIEVSMTEAASMAFLAWLEAAPPGEHLVA